MVGLVDIFAARVEVLVRAPPEITNTCPCRLAPSVPAIQMP